MTKSDWIALAACIATFLALIPSFLTLMRDRKPKKQLKKNNQPEIKQNTEVKPENQKKSHGPFMNAFVLTIMAVVIGIIEFILFSWFAYMFGVVVEFGKMPLIWNVVFYSLFLIPGVLLFLALINILGTFED
jgi:hypothetical protein